MAELTDLTPATDTTASSCCSAGGAGDLLRAE